VIVGLVADTHGLVRPEALAALAGVDRILHAGDIGGRAVVEAFSSIAEVLAVRGNNDRDPWGRTLPARIDVELEGVRIRVAHDRNDRAAVGRLETVDVLVVDHSHRPTIERRGALLVVNPGSAGPRRFSLPIGIARLEVDEGRAQAELVPITPRR
jgi:hypothetical protein